MSGEDDLIARLFAPIAGPGALGLKDDAAILEPSPLHDMVLTVDALVAGVHFFPDDPPELIARKALRVNLSDLAAKGATPRGFLLTFAMPASLSDDWLTAFAAGLAQDAAAYALPLLGGDTVRMPGPLTLSVTAFGEVPRGRMVQRTTAQADDLLFVTGDIGRAAIGLQCRLKPEDGWVQGLDDTQRAALHDGYLLPQPRNALMHVVRAQARAGMDVSDGLIGDVAKMMRASDVAGRIRLDHVPFSPAVAAAIGLAPHLRETAVTGGDDYELLLAVPPERADVLRHGAAAVGVAVTQIGDVLDPQPGMPELLVTDGQGKAYEFAIRSFSHL
jgi:thiamine-monophosphate kinase